MFAHLLLDVSVPVLKTFQTVDDALQTVQDTFFRNLPVTDDSGNYVGMIREDQLLETMDQDALLERLAEPIAALKPDTHLFDILKEFTQNGLSILPVADESGLLLGCISHESVIQHLTRESAVAEPGGIIVLELKAIDYSLAEIARIVESNNAVVLHSYITPRQDREKILVTLKLNKIDLKEVIATFERFEYQIVAVFHISEYEEGLKERYDSLMMYLDV